MRDVALTLSSGGARGLAHIGAIEELEHQGYHISSVAGCSMGALVGGMYAAGKLEDFKLWLKTVDKRKIFSLIDLSLSMNHLVKGERIIDALEEIVPDVNIEDLPIPYCAVATDWENGRMVEFHSGSLYHSIRASISIPLFFSPVRRDGMVLVDGGILNPLPLKQSREMPGDLLVAVNVCSSFNAEETEMRKAAEERAMKKRPKVLSLLSEILPASDDLNYYTIANRLFSIMMKQNATLNIELYKPDILVDITTGRFGSFEYDKADVISQLGRNSMRKALSEDYCSI